MYCPRIWKGCLTLLSIISPVLLIVVHISQKDIYFIINIYIYRGKDIFKNLTVCTESLCYHFDKKNVTDLFLLKQWLSQEKRVLSEDLVAIVYDSDASSNYYHWLIEVCPRILLLREIHPDCILIVPFPVSEYIIETSKALGFDKLMPIKKTQIIKAPFAVLAEHTSEHKDFHLHQDPLLICKVREAILKHLIIEKNKPFRRVHVSRSKQKMRRLINEEALVQCLSEYGFQTVYFEDMSFNEQVQLIYDTEIFIGIHGANMTNMLFMQPGTTTIEIINEAALNSVYFRIASYTNTNYCCLPSKSQQLDVFENDADLEVDINEVKHTLHTFARM